MRSCSWYSPVCGSAETTAAQEGDCAFAAQAIQNKTESKMILGVVAQTSHRFYCTATWVDAAGALALSALFSTGRRPEHDGLSQIFRAPVTFPLAAPRASL
jgi:hypothetical protein